MFRVPEEGVGGVWGWSVVVLLGVVNGLPRGDLGQPLIGAPKLPRGAHLGKRKERRKKVEGGKGKGGGAA